MEKEKIYKCDPNKNVNCEKRSCYINGGECYMTTDKKYEKRDDEECQ